MLVFEFFELDHLALIESALCDEGIPADIFRL
jgi:hypothetical protein